MPLILAQLNISNFAVQWRGLGFPDMFIADDTQCIENIFRDSSTVEQLPVNTKTHLSSIAAS